MRRPASVRRAGPYRVHSLADGNLRVEPQWPDFRPYTDADGGGPGLLSRMGLAADLERWLNDGLEADPAGGGQQEAGV